MSKNNIHEFNIKDEPISSHDLLTNTLRAGAQNLLAMAVEAEVSEFIDMYQKELGNGLARL